MSSTINFSFYHVPNHMQSIQEHWPPSTALYSRIFSTSQSPDCKNTITKDLKNFGNKKMGIHSLISCLYKVKVNPLPMVNKLMYNDYIEILQNPNVYSNCSKVKNKMEGGNPFLKEMTQKLSQNP